MIEPKNSRSRSRIDMFDQMEEGQRRKVCDDESPAHMKGDAHVFERLDAADARIRRLLQIGNDPLQNLALSKQMIVSIASSE